jgi:hypothetical protein
MAARFAFQRIAAFFAVLPVLSLLIAVSPISCYGNPRSMPLRNYTTTAGTPPRCRPKPPAGGHRAARRGTAALTAPGAMVSK